VNDVTLIEEMLTRRFSVVDIVKLVDAGATYDNVIAALMNLKAKCTGNDTVVIHFSGRGSAIFDPVNHKWRESLLMHDSRRHKTMQDLNKELTDEWMNHYLRAFPSSNVTLIIDSCHSGGTTRNQTRNGRGAPYQADMKGDPSKLTKALGFKSCRGVLLTACRDSEVASELSLPKFSFDMRTKHKRNDQTDSEPRFYGVFTYMLCQQLAIMTNQQHTYAIHQISSGDVYDKVKLKVSETVQQVYNRPQNPALEGLKNKQLFGVKVLPRPIGLAHGLLRQVDHASEVLIDASKITFQMEILRWTAYNGNLCPRIYSWQDFRHSHSAHALCFVNDYCRLVIRNNHDFDVYVSLLEFGSAYGIKYVYRVPCECVCVCVCVRVCACTYICVCAFLFIGTYESRIINITDLFIHLHV